ncbi:Glycosyl transferase group 1 [Hyella patelloides LEGE 07179]|uniref:Glycosyl transferase group 1 n=1 Tax=Hyella patelloides LEGE 07179 TaxID=945734 RepID=A0A563VQT4_9CYAN|nr:glycosyltransferase family 4 protein [Hyella patelloides]VEP13735.1 Glycosyl transferase group 1 [Hyella patelloides LEGE 07179]
MSDRVFIFLEIFAREGGIQSYVKDVFQAYLNLENPSEETAEVFLLRDEFGCENPYETAKLKFHYLKTLPAWKGRLNLAIALCNCLLLRRPRHVYCGHIKLAPLIKLLCQPLGIPYTVLTYGKEVWQTLPSKEQTALQQANSIWTISRYSRDRVTQANKIDSERIAILPCIVDSQQFTPGEKPAALLARYDLTNAKVLMTVARLWSGDIYKGVDVTIRALPEILKVFPEVKYLVIGRGDDRPRLETLATELAISDRVVFAGFVPTAELADHYRVADAYVMPSQEGFGIVYLEAMACGKPVLSGDADGSTDPLQDGLLGWQVPHRDPDAVAKACLEILQKSDRRCDGQWLREKTLAKFSQQALQQKLAQLLTDN